jgi:hypothetical protein
MPVLWNVVLFQIGWFACVLGAAKGLPWLGPMVVLAVLFLQVTRTKDNARESAILASSALIGLSFDTTLIAAGVISPLRHAFPAPLSPPWLIALWPNFAATLNVSLRWLQGRYGSAAVLGSLGGPAAYWSGAALGAITIPEPLARNLLVLSVSWTAVVPLLLLLGAAIRRRTNR